MRRHLLWFCTAAFLWLAAAASAPANVSLRFQSRLESEAARKSIQREIRAFCREHGWQFTVERATRRGQDSTCIRFKDGRESPWLEIRVFGSGLVEGAFDTMSASPLIHVRLINIIDRLESHLSDLEVRDATRFYERRNHHALRRHFRDAQALLQKVKKDAFRRGEDITVGSKLFTEIPQPARRAFQYAVTALERGAEAAAKHALDQAIGLHSEFARALVLRAELEIGNGDLAAARADADLAIGIKPEMAAGYRARARVHTAREHSMRALADLDRALELEPGATECRVLRGLLHQRIHGPKRALPDLERVTRSLLGSSPAASDAFPGGLPRESAISALRALRRCYRLLGAHGKEARVDRRLRQLGAPAAEARVITNAETGAARASPPVDSRILIDSQGGLTFTPLPGWQLEARGTDPRILVRMAEPKLGASCRIAVMKQWGRIDDASFRKTFDRSVLKGLAVLGAEPRILKASTSTAGAFPVYQILVELSLESPAHCWVACLHHGGKMFAVYLSSVQTADQSGRTLRSILANIRADGTTAP